MTSSRSSTLAVSTISSAARSRRSIPSRAAAIFIPRSTSRAGGGRRGWGRALRGEILWGVSRRKSLTRIHLGCISCMPKPLCTLSPAHVAIPTLLAYLRRHGISPANNQTAGTATRTSSSRAQRCGDPGCRCRAAQEVLPGDGWPAIDAWWRSDGNGRLPHVGGAALGVILDADAGVRLIPPHMRKGRPRSSLRRPPMPTPTMSCEHHPASCRRRAQPDHPGICHPAHEPSRCRPRLGANQLADGAHRPVRPAAGLAQSLKSFSRDHRSWTAPLAPRRRRRIVPILILGPCAWRRYARINGTVLGAIPGPGAR